MPILDQLQSDLDAITDDQIARSIATLDPPAANETVVGTVSDPSIRRLWALSFEYHRRSHKMAFDALYETPRNGPEQVASLALVRYLDDLSAAIRDLTWAQIKQEIGPAAWKGDGIGLRAGYAVVTLPEEPETQVSASVVKLPAALAQAFKQLMKNATEDNGDSPSSTRKPQ